jgi:hypothetical protein
MAIKALGIIAAYDNSACLRKCFLAATDDLPLMLKHTARSQFELERRKFDLQLEQAVIKKHENGEETIGVKNSKRKLRFVNRFDGRPRPLTSVWTGEVIRPQEGTYRSIPPIAPQASKEERLKRAIGGLPVVATIPTLGRGFQITFSKQKGTVGSQSRKGGSDAQPIKATGHASPAVVNTSSGWTKEEDEELMRRKTNNETWAQMSEALGKTKDDLFDRFKTIRPADWKANPNGMNGPGCHGCHTGCDSCGPSSEGQKSVSNTAYGRESAVVNTFRSANRELYKSVLVNKSSSSNRTPCLIPIPSRFRNWLWMTPSTTSLVAMRKRSLTGHVSRQLKIYSGSALQRSIQPGTERVWAMRRIHQKVFRVVPNRVPLAFLPHL